MRHEGGKVGLSPWQTARPVDRLGSAPPRRVTRRPTLIDEQCQEARVDRARLQPTSGR
jgi:hypothetical protein